MTEWRERSRIWHSPFIPVFYIIKDYDELDEMTRDLYRQGMTAFGGIAPTYHIALHYMGFSFPAAVPPDDVQLYVNGYRQYFESL